MEINFICKKTKKEDRYIKPFAEFYLSKYFPGIKKVTINCPDEDTRGSFPDYSLVEPKIAVEIKRIVDERRTSETISTSYNVQRIQKALNKLVLTEKLPNTKYYLKYPSGFPKIKREKKSLAVAEKIIDEIKSNHHEFNINGIGNFEVISELESKKPEIILAGRTDGPISPNLNKILNDIMYKIIKKANDQLGSVKSDKKVLLLINAYPFVDNEIMGRFLEPRAVSLSLYYKDIDEIWLQVEEIDNYNYELLCAC